jgi:hypothetical protein
MLMAHAEKLAASSNFEQVKLYTNKLLVENVQLYIRPGYSVDREEEVVSGIKGTSPRGALATKQSILSLRGEMDCFVAPLLAMTVWLFDN